MSFIRQCTATIEAVYKNDADLFFNEWKQLRTSGSICQSGSCPFVPESSFDYDPEHFLYYRTRAITADIPNSNGDYFPLPEIEASYPTFIGKGVFLNHANDDPEKAFGLILDSVLHKDAKYVELLCALDKEVAEEKHPGILHKVNTGQINATSMSCLCDRAECGVCHHLATNAFELCAHMNPKENSYVKGRRAGHGGELAYEINYGLTFTEDSLVFLPADHTARILQIYSSLNKDASIEEIKSKLAEIQNLIEGLK